MYSNISEMEHVQKAWKLISSVASEKKIDAHNGRTNTTVLNLQEKN